MAFAVASLAAVEAWTIENSDDYTGNVPDATQICSDDLGSFSDEQIRKNLSVYKIATYADIKDN